MDHANRERLAKRLEEAGVEDLAGLRRFLKDGTMPPPVAAFLLGLLPPKDDTVIGECHLLVHLASGGMGTVWLAEHHGELVVIKTLKGEVAEDQVYLKRFEREAAITASLHHPHVVRCLGHGTDNGMAYLRLEFVAGGDLEHLIRRRGDLDEVHALNIMLQSTRGLENAWKMALVHRDIKPANLFIDLAGRVKVADFGLARSIQADAQPLTGPGMTMGSPAYMSPELIRGKPLDCRTDIYACGCVLYECLAGQPPFNGTQAETIQAHVGTPPPDVRSMNPKVGNATARIIARTLEKDRDKRIGSPAEMIRLLTTALQELGHDPDAALPTDIIKASTAVMPAVVIEPASNRRKPSSSTVRAVKRERSGSVDPDQPPAQGDFAAAFTGERLTLSGGDLLLILLAQDSAVFGKLLSPPGDISLRDYPPELNEHACSRVSRQHFRITTTNGQATICDLGSTNGTEVDGTALIANEPKPLAPICDHVVEISESISLIVRAIPQRGEALTDLPHMPPPTHPPGPGLAAHGGWDAVVIRRTGNRPTLSYALVPRTLSIGPVTADLPVSGWRGTGFEVAQWNGHWLWRRGQEPWKGLAAGLIFGMTARAGVRDDLR